MHTWSTQSLWSPSVLDWSLPLTKDCIIDQVGCSVHAAEGVVDWLVSDSERSVVGHYGVVEHILGVFAGHVLWTEEDRIKQ